MWIWLRCVEMALNKCSYGSIISGVVGCRNRPSYSFYAVLLSVSGPVNGRPLFPFWVAPLIMSVWFAAVPEVVLYSVLGSYAALLPSSETAESIPIDDVLAGDWTFWFARWPLGLSTCGFQEFLLNIFCWSICSIYFDVAFFTHSAVWIRVVLFTVNQFLVGIRVKHSAFKIWFSMMEIGVFWILIKTRVYLGASLQTGCKMIEIDVNVNRNGIN